MAGYSGTPLDRKLGLADGQRILLVGAPDDLIPVPAGATLLRSTRPPVDVAVVFVTARAELERRFPALLRALPPTGALWVAWPKKASGVATDMTEDVVRAVGLPTGLVDNKVCAIDDTWSGLRLVVRRERRPAWNQ